MKTRYNSINDLLKRRFGGRVHKVSLDMGSTCPNKDGRIASAGCIFCNLDSHRPATEPQSPPEPRSIKEQLIDGIEYLKGRHRTERFIAYFQGGSNTYGPRDELAKIFREAIDHEEVIGLAISTRPDCIDEGCVKILSSLPSELLLWIELGLQSAHDKTLSELGRGHTVAQFSEAHRLLKNASIPTCAHVILGLPNEDRTIMRETAKFLNKEKIWGVKIHNLHVLKGTKLEELYLDGKIKLQELQEYADSVVDFIEALDPSITIHRFNSHSPRRLTCAPEWSINKLAILNAVELRFKERDSWQGKNLAELQEIDPGNSIHAID